MTSISSQSLLWPVRQSVLAAQSGLAQVQTELSSGYKADLGLSLGADAGRTISMKVEIEALSGYASANAVAATRLDGTATTLSAMLKSAQAMSASLVTASSTGGTTAGLQANAKAALGALTSGLNLSVGGQYVFGGINSAAAPVSDYSDTSSSKAAVNSAFQQAFGFDQSSANASSIDGDAMKSFLDGDFASLFDASGWSSTWSKASDTAISGAVSPSQKATTSVSANEAAFRQIVQAYTMLAEFTGPTMSDAAKSAVVAKASALISAGLAALTDVQADVGATQAAVDAANTRMSAQVTVLKGNVGDLEGVDTYALSTRVTALQTQLQASYELTSRLQQLSLVNYLQG